LNKQRKPLTYRDAGVDIDAGDALVEAIKPLAQSTAREGCMSGLGGFGALFQIPPRFRQPVLVSGTDGVGTKLKLAFRLQRHDTVGIDLVAMCVNDVLVQGAEPLFFLDYFAAGKLDQTTATAVVAGIAEGCRQAGCALIGGETAEMPGMYSEGEYDMAGFCVGAVEKDRLVDGSRVAPGDRIIGLASSGAHSNGYSLIRKLIDIHAVDLTSQLAGATLADHLLAPTRIYVKPVLTLLEQIPVHAIAHITGGGLPGNLSRVLPANCCAELDSNSWTLPPILTWLEELSGIDKAEMYRTFNCGIGMALIVPADRVDQAVSALSASGETPVAIGHISESDGTATVVIHD
jgi:phosphoribosylformylglycinamidine cyclo-ligase